MISQEILKKVKRLELNTRKLVDDMMGGQFKSHFKGHGVQFSEHRVYNHGDDVRHIDWKAGARSREMLIKKFEEERELTVLLVVDVSGSAFFGSQDKLKSEVMAELGGMIAYAVTRTGDKVGVLFFTDHVEKIIVPKKGRQHVLRIIRDLLTFKPQKSGTKLSEGLAAARRVLKQSSVVFVLSDFMDQGFERELKVLSKKHDVVALWLKDKRESEIPKGLGTVPFLDPETGEEVLVQTGSYRFRKYIEELVKKRDQAMTTLFTQSGVEALKIQTEEDYGELLVRFFKKRKRK